MTLGPVQVLLVGTSAEPDGTVLAELDRLAGAGIVHLIDLVVVRRVDQDSLDTLPMPEGLHAGLGRIAEEFLAGPGFSPEQDVDGDAAAAAADVEADEADEAERDSEPEGGAGSWSVLEAVPVGETAVIALIEHLWAVPLRAALQSAGAAPLGESWLGPADLADLDAIVERHAGSPV